MGLIVVLHVMIKIKLSCSIYTLTYKITTLLLTLANISLSIMTRKKNEDDNNE